MMYMMMAIVPSMGVRQVKLNGREVKAEGAIKIRCRGQSKRARRPKEGWERRAVRSRQRGKKRE